MSTLHELIKYGCFFGGKGSGGSGGGTQPDWNQNDPTKADYVKNRPFYTEIAEKTVSIAEAPTFVPLPGFPVFAVGDTVTLKVNGVEHTAVAFDDGGYAAIGDTKAALMSGSWDFGWQIYPSDDGDGVICACFVPCTVSYMGENIRKIDTRYLPGFVVNLDELEFGNTTLAWFSEGTETATMSEAQWYEMVELANNGNKIVCGRSAGMYEMLHNDDGDIEMFRTQVHICGGFIRVSQQKRTLTYDKEQQLCTCTYSEESGKAQCAE